MRLSFAHYAIFLLFGGAIFSAMQSFCSDPIVGANNSFINSHAAMKQRVDRGKRCL